MKQFDALQVKVPKRNAFDMSHEVALTCDMGELIPILCEEVYPNDTWKGSSEVLVRFAPLLAPIFHRIDVFVHYFFVPNRLTFPDWEDFITNRDKGASTVEKIPTYTITNAVKSHFEQNDLPDYMGIPPIGSGQTVTTEYEINVLPFLGYQKIWWEYYRDQNLQYDELDFDDTIYNSVLMFAKRRRAWERDYFTSALPFAQKGDESTLVVNTTSTPSYLTSGAVVDQSGNDYPASGTEMIGSAAGVLSASIGVNDDEINIQNLAAVQTATGSIKVEDFRVALRVQEWMEKNARMGSRYVELLLAHFGVRSSDARLQRPEYLGGGKQHVVISEIVQTQQDRKSLTDTNDLNTPTGTLTGHGISMGKSNYFSFFAEEHGFVYAILSVMPKPSYSQGLHKKFSRLDYLDYMWPSFAQLGEQEVLNQELLVDYETVNNDDEGTFGYQSRYAELKQINNKICAEMRTDYDHWHLSRQFDVSSFPALNETFIQCNPDTRIFAVEDADDQNLTVQVYHDLTAVRALPYFNIPSII